ncbi:MAG: DnaA/Hda family protein, partial [Rhizobiaceae bacterium]
MHSGMERAAHAAVPSRRDIGGGEVKVAANAEAVFEKVKTQLRVKLGADVYSSWFGRIALEEASKSVVRLSVPTAFLRSWINNHYVDVISQLWKAEEPDVLKVDIVVRSAVRSCRSMPAPEQPMMRKPVRPGQPPVAPTHAANGNAERPSARGTTPPADPRQAGVLGSPLDAKYTFASFVEGPSNRVALAAARAVAEGSPTAMRFNPLFIHATVGLGKTHLLQAIAAESVKRRPQSRMVYLTAEYFMWRFATAIRDNNALVLKEQLRDIDLLIIDDMQFLHGKSIQNEFCHLINMLLDSARQVVVAADRPPSDLESLDARVRSRLNGGVSLEMAQPDFSMRLSMLKARLEAARVEDKSLEISEEMLQHVARTITGSGRE